VVRWACIGALVAALLAVGPVSDGARPVPTAFAADGARQVVVMVPTRRMLAGEIIEPEDLREASVSAESLRPSAIVEAKNLVGMQVRRALSPGRVILSSSIQTPVLVARNSEVTVVFVDGTLRLTMKAKALDDGSLGEVIRVANPSSGKILFASVAGAGEVHISK